MQQPTYECSEHIFACNPTLPHINYITIGKSLVKGSKKKSTNLVKSALLNVD